MEQQGRSKEWYSVSKGQFMNTFGRGEDEARDRAEFCSVQFHPWVFVKSIEHLF